ncbi:MAG: monovalent cation/H(+) antiporter subunit G [Planctomycetota bacterium]
MDPAMLNESVAAALGALALAADAPDAYATAATADSGGPTIFLELLAATLAVVGSIFCLLASIGTLRFPDVYTRMQAATKAGTLGVGCLVFTVPAHFASVGAFAEAILVLAFFFLTAPVAGHLIGRAAYLAGSPIWAKTQRDELRGCYCKETHLLHPIPMAQLDALESEAAGSTEGSRSATKSAG